MFAAGTRVNRRVRVSPSCLIAARLVQLRLRLFNRGFTPIPDSLAAFPPLSGTVSGVERLSRAFSWHDPEGVMESRALGMCAGNGGGHLAGRSRKASRNRLVELAGQTTDRDGYITGRTGGYGNTRRTGTISKLLAEVGKRSPRREGWATRHSAYQVRSSLGSQVEATHVRYCTAALVIPVGQLLSQLGANLDSVGGGAELAPRGAFSGYREGLLPVLALDKQAKRSCVPCWLQTQLGEFFLPWMAQEDEVDAASRMASG
ncbi:hypothetical protein B0H63DRAFT_531079 [Podospora didyma]|uniref:Uncharacterized protein n=1 Tax=Podospora didyma TaxID=330526 RepID=A0AAE0U745_9PEZI|nr:hypothetical protein B0H63DRAFT_531079 [Podospora didyma]